MRSQKSASPETVGAGKRQAYEEIRDLIRKRQEKRITANRVTADDLLGAFRPWSPEEEALWQFNLNRPHCSCCSGPRLSKQDRDLLRALRSELTVAFDKTAFREALAQLQDRTGTTILVDEEALRDAKIALEDPVSLPSTTATYGTILRKVLAGRRLAYVPKDGTIHITTVPKARKLLATRTELLRKSVPPELLANRTWLKGYVDGLIKTIQRLDPESWDVNGGPGTITYDEERQALVIRASLELLRPVD
jgi:hypothetical protein